MVKFVGAGPGAVDLITLRGKKALVEADVIVYAGSLVNPELLNYKKDSCLVYDSSSMTLQEVLNILISSSKKNLKVVRLHTGDPSIYGAIKEQMDALKAEGVDYSIVPGVSSFLAANTLLMSEYTLPGITQTIILTRLGGRTPVPLDESIDKLACHNATMVIFLSVSMLDELTSQLVKGGYSPECPAAIVYKVTWSDEKIIYTNIESLEKAAKENNITKTALIFIGEFISPKSYDFSKLYDSSFTHAYRLSKKES